MAFDELNQLKQIISKEPIALFLGSGISKDSPSSLPTGNELKEKIMEEILNGIKIPESINKDVNNTISELRLEVFLYLLDEWKGRYDWKERMDFIMDSQPNHNHYNIANLFNKKIVELIITTNFDTLIEDSFKPKKTQLFYSDDDFKKIDENKAVPGLYKIHGSICDWDGNKTHDSIIGSITEVANNAYLRLSQNKSDFLRYILENYVVIFLGYSGEDVDIFPIIENSNVKQIIWVLHSQNSSNKTFEFYSDANRREDSPIDKLIKKHLQTIGVYCNTFLSFLSEENFTDNLILIEEYDKSESKTSKDIQLSKSPYSLLSLILRYGNKFESSVQASSLALFEKNLKDVDSFLKSGKLLSSLSYAAELLRDKGISLKELNNLQDALKCLEEAKRLIESQYNALNKDEFSTPNNYFIMMSQIYEDIGLIHLEKKDFDKAYKSLIKAKELSKKLEVPKKTAFLARNYGNLGVICCNCLITNTEKNDSSYFIEKFSEANSFFKKATKLETKVGNLVGLAKTQNNWANLLSYGLEWNKSFQKGISSLVLMDSLEAPFSEEEKENCKIITASSLSAMVPNQKDAEKLLEIFPGPNMKLKTKSKEKIIELYKIYRKIWEASIYMT
ncbi:SIR2 family protein [Methanobacterium sp.]|uniref:SIR2 family protein n=1 Tax=Methanobacterium sp. TaxID=2164 RepID=UPI0025E75FCB|nr:SIR2 family protein [Methanobacterium sp.]MBI5459736.1 SIR2 family protein [Methanobacterium sp.]